ncbi:MAG: rhodanese-like domain-containing protein [Acidobacteriaceae bacterium]
MMSVVRSRRPGIFVAALFFLLLSSVPHGKAQIISPTSGPGSALSIPQSQWIQPEALAQLLRSVDSHKPLILQVGSHVLYSEAHIPGSSYVGPGSQPAGLHALQEKVSALPRKQFIVLYCGCCPWNHCPNISPAYQQMRAMGFTNVKVLYLPNNFGTDWANKGYPVE